MLMIRGKPAAEAYATAFGTNPDYIASHNVNMVNVTGETGILSLYLMDEHHIHCRMQGELFPEADLVELCGAISHLPYSLLASTALLEQAQWLRNNAMYQAPTRTGRPTVDRGYASDRR